MRSALSAAGLWVVYVLVFAIAGGLATGIMAWAFELIVAEPFNDAFYSVCFGVTGFIAYRLARDVVEGGTRGPAPAEMPARRRPVDTGKPLI
jgi:hypothetical protein